MRSIASTLRQTVSVPRSSVQYSCMIAPSEHAALILEPGRLRLAALRRIARAPVALVLAESDRSAIAASAAIVARIVSEGATVYGVNTGFGKLAQVSIPADQLEAL